MVVLWICVGTGMLRTGLDLFGDRPVSYLGTDPRSALVFRSGLIVAAVLMAGFSWFVFAWFSARRSFLVAFLVGLVGQVVAAVVLLSGPGSSHAIHTVGGLVLGASLPILMWRFAVGIPFGHGAGIPFRHGAGIPFGHGAGPLVPQPTTRPAGLGLLSAVAGVFRRNRVPGADNSARRRVEAYGLMWLEVAACGAGVALSAAMRAPIAEIVPALGFHLWVAVVTAWSRVPGVGPSRKSAAGAV